MSHRPSNPDASSSDDGTSPFGGLGAGLGMFQSWMKAASSAMPGLGGQGTSASSNWTMPTLDPEELDKRIQDLKTVQFWLEQNARMIGMTIQTLEVQRMTLETLKGMKVPLDAIRESLKVRPQESTPTQAAPEAPQTPPPASAPGGDAAQAPAADGAVNPMQWWSTLTEQFSHLAQQAVQATQPSDKGAKPPAAPKASTASRKSAAGKPAAKKAAGKTTARKTTASRSAPRSKPQAQGD